MNAHEHTDPHGDGLTITHDNGKVWITCTSKHTEVTVGPLPADILDSDRDTLSLVQQQRDQATARAEKAERERDEADESAEKHRRAEVDHSTNARCWMKTSEEWQATAEEWEKRALAAEPRPLTPDAIEVALRECMPSIALERMSGTRVMRLAEDMHAALTEPPARPEWEQAGAKALTLTVWGMEIPNEAGEAGDKLAASLARHGYKVVPITDEDGAA